MRVVADSGLWSTGPADAPVESTFLVAVLEASGAVLSWTIDAPPDDAATHIVFTDVARADWLWRILGEQGHVTLAASLGDVDLAPPEGIELAGVDIQPGSVGALRRLALGHWLRRWWPASRIDGIAGLDRAVLDAEVALLTASAHAFFPDDTLDSDVAGLLAPHAAALLALVAEGDPRVLQLVRAAVGLAEDLEGLDDPAWAELTAQLDDPRDIARAAGRRDDYALAAGAGTGPRGVTEIAWGVASLTWSSVPPAIFDAGERTVEWSIDADGAAVVRAAVIGPDPASGVAVRLRSGTAGGAATLDAAGRATVPLTDAEGRALSPAAAWDHDWSDTEVSVGVPVPATAESPAQRERVRRWVRGRLERPSPEAFLAEILAAESTY